MKKVILSLLFIILTIISNAQTEGFINGGGVIWADSLTTYSATSASDSSWIIKLDYLYSFLSVTVKDTGTSITDSVKLYKGVERFSNNGVLQDTFWTTEALPVKINDWTSDTTLVAAGKIRSYTLLENNIKLLKITRINAIVTAGIKTDILVEGVMERRR